MDTKTEMVYENLENLIANLEERFSEIIEERKLLLRSFAEHIISRKREGLKIRLIFICTHNSRRSHMSQIWAQTATEYFGISDVDCYSGGTEATAFNPRAVNTVEEFGFTVFKIGNSRNPIYKVSFSDDKEPLNCFSKIYNDAYNPQKDFTAIMTCSHANETCPIVSGAEAKFTINYDDPKEFDGTELEEFKYKERFEQIGIEMIYALKYVSNNFNNFTV